MGVNSATRDIVIRCLPRMREDTMYSEAMKWMPSSRRLLKMISIDSGSSGTKTIADPPRSTQLWFMKAQRGSHFRSLSPSRPSMEISELETLLMICISDSRFIIKCVFELNANSWTELGFRVVGTTDRVPHELLRSHGIC